jgi:chromosome segregation protein
MDKGAHFHRCDFQVHTPRDLNWKGSLPKADADRQDYQWSGGIPVSDSERKAYAITFIAACRAKALQAVAITDHHDLGFFPWLLQASKDELLPDGTPVSEHDRIKVFPGMELTLAVPCQALLILDESFPQEWFDAVATSLGLQCTSPEEAKHGSIQRRDHLTTLQKVIDVLEVQPQLKGRYLLLPNVDDGGEFTIMRKGFSGEYRAMPCVGGYLDHTIESIGVGTRRILDGKVAEYDFKALGIFPTSDNRNADFSLLGKHSAWVKWAEPTAEALRQACLARKTRILHSPPTLPAIVVSRIEVSNSKFLGPLNLELNDQFNALIGGRGTGKSSVLEYVRWALCDQTRNDHEDDSQLGAKRQKFIENTLRQIGGVVTVEVLKNKVVHMVRRKSEPPEVWLKIGSQPMELTTEDEVASLLPIQGYSQKQLSGVGVRNSELLRFVESAGTQEALEALEEEAKELANAVRRSFQQLEEKREHSKSSEHLQMQLSSLEQQAAALKAALSGLSTEDESLISRHEVILAGNSLMQQWETDQREALSAVQRVLREVALLPNRMASGSPCSSEHVLTNAQSEADKAFEHVRQLLDQAGAALSPAHAQWAKFRGSSAEWLAGARDHEIRYGEVKNRLAQHQQVLQEIAKLDDKISTLRRQKLEATNAANGLTASEAHYHSVRTRWEEKFSGRADLLSQRCTLLSTLSDGWIKATLRRGVMGPKLGEHLSKHLQGSRIHSMAEKMEQLGRAISEADNPMIRWGEVLAEIDSLTRHHDNENLPACIHLRAASFTENDLAKIGQKIGRAAWLELSLIELEDLPVFEYRQRESEYIPFADASAGQQATALLRVLLNQEGPPLLVDQPEDDLDNQIIYAIAELVGQAKQRRQLIFTTHNANLVVNGDADLVVAFGYRIQGEQSGGEIQAEGAIDVKSVRDAITTIMEGGEKAFQLRKAKYGF